MKKTMYKACDNLYIKASTKMFTVKKRINGNLHEKSTGVKGQFVIGDDGEPEMNSRNGCAKTLKGLGAARKRRDEIIFDWGSDSKSSKQLRNCKRLTFNDLFDSRLDWKKKNRAIGTYEIAKYQIEKVRSWFQENCKFVDQFSYEMWDRLVEWHREYYPNKGMKHLRENILFCLNYAMREGLINRKFEQSQMELPSSKKQLPRRALTDEEIRKLLHACDPHMTEYILRGKVVPQRYEGNPTLKFQIRLQLYMGLRPGSEVLRMMWSHIDYKSREYCIPPENDKTRRGRRVPIPDIIWDELILLKKSSKSKFVFPFRDTRKGTQKPIVDNSRCQSTNAKSFERAVQRAGIDRITPHFLRHTYITHVLATDIPIAEVSRFAGLSVEVMMKVYLHTSSESIQRARKVLEHKEWG